VPARSTNKAPPKRGFLSLSHKELYGFSAPSDWGFQMIHHPSKGTSTGVLESCHLAKKSRGQHHEFHFLKKHLMQRYNIARIIAIRNTLMPDKVQKSNDKSRVRRMGAICRKERNSDNFLNL